VGKENIVLTYYDGPHAVLPCDVCRSTACVRAARWYGAGEETPQGVWAALRPIQAACAAACALGYGPDRVGP
jgi:hypothetical protein